MYEVKMPQMGQSVEEASIVRWLKAVGDSVKQGDPLFAIQTDKAEIECESPAAGILRKIVLEPDVTVPVMTLVALIGTPDEALPDIKVQTAAPKAAATANASRTAASAAPIAAQPAHATLASENAAVSPRAKRRAAELHLNPALANGSGVGGRVLEADIFALAESNVGIAASPTAKRIAASRGVDLRVVKGTGPRGRITQTDVERQAVARVPSPGSSGTAKRVPLSPMRRIIAQRMSDSIYTAPHYYVTVEVDMAAAVQFRSGKTTDKPSYNDIVLFGTAKALQEFPGVNARWAEDSIEEQGEINLGFAVALPTGLIVPVVRNVESKSLSDVSRDCRSLVDKARTGKLTPDDYAGSTFTISNLGVYGVDDFTAIINQPDSAILAVGQIKERPVVIGGGIHVRPIMKITMSSDHRVIDGALSAQFMGRLREILEAGVFE